MGLVRFLGEMVGTSRKVFVAVTLVHLYNNQSVHGWLGEMTAVVFRVFNHYFWVLRRGNGGKIAAFIALDLT